MPLVKKTQTSYRKKLIITLIILVVCVAGGMFAYKHFLHHTLTTKDGQKVNLAPPTKTDKQAADATKQAIVNRDTQLKGQTQNPSTTAKASVVVTSADGTSVRGYVNGVFEDGGTCTATATQSTTVITQTSAGFQNVSDTQCAPITWSTPLSSGNWTVTLSYNSSTSTGSTTMTIKVN